MMKGKTAIIAGSGGLPLALAERLARRGASPYLVLLRGNADSRLRAYRHCEISVTEFAKLIAALKAEKIRNIVLAGGVKKRPHWRNLHWDWPTAKALPKLFFALKRGDDALLRAFIGLMEGYGFHIIGAHEIAPELLAPKSGALTKISAGKSERADIKLAAAAAKKLGAQDIGQGAVAIGGQVAALEDAAGTDALLARVASMRLAGKIPPSGGVLVKMKKPNQDSRADLPAIGAETVEKIHQAGLAGLAVEAGGSFILNKKTVIELADKYGLFIESL